MCMLSTQLLEKLLKIIPIFGNVRRITMPHQITHSQILIIEGRRCHRISSSRYKDNLQQLAPIRIIS